jgi:hypothetical protein
MAIIKNAGEDELKRTHTLLWEYKLAQSLWRSIIDDLIT